MQAEQILVHRFFESDPAAAARVLERYQPEQIVALCTQLAPEITAKAFGRVTAGVAARSMALMEPSQAAAVVVSMSPVSAANILRRIGSDARKTILEAMPAAPRERVRRLIHYPEGTVGAIMGTDIPMLPADGLAGDEVLRLGLPGGIAGRSIWVVNREGKLLGAIGPSALAAVSEETRIEKLATPAPATLSPQAALSAVLAQTTWTEVDELPVVDLDGVLLGILEHKQLRVWAGAKRGVDETDALRTMLGLGELMWLGLHGLVDAMASAAITEEKR